MPDQSVNAERQRLESNGSDWSRWGPYLSERAWGTVREDYSADGDAWNFFPYEHARSRTYRWSEDGLAGISDDHQRLCFAFAFWNGVDSTIKERIYGLAGSQGNHGEDAKEYWWYEDCTPTHSWMRWRYVYSQQAFPYEQLVDANRGRGKLVGEYELLDTGIFDNDEYWDICVDYAKADTDDICIRLTARNAGPRTATLHVLPTIWYRNVWSWGIDDPRSAKPVLRRDGERAIQALHPVLGDWTLEADVDTPSVFCDNETNDAVIWGTDPTSRYPKDGINDYIVNGSDTVNPDGAGTKAAFHRVVTVEPGEQATIHLRLRNTATAAGTDIQDVFADRQREADEFYADLAPEAPAEEQMIMRKALSGMLWSKQLFHYDVERWLDGDPAGVAPPESRKKGRNSAWPHLDNFDIVSMPDKWEYPWYAAWDLAFHCVALAHVDTRFAKDQLLLMLREWYMHPNGQLPAYEWNFSDVNPPVHAWAAMRVFEIDGAKDYDFLERVFHKLLLNFTWWVNQKDQDGNNVFEGGFLGLDNIGPVNRSNPLPVPGRLEQADGTAWMAGYCLAMLETALVLARRDNTYEDLATKFFEHFALIARAMDEQGLWDEEDGFYYDNIRLNSGENIPLRVRSTVGLMPLLAVTTVNRSTLEELPEFAARLEWLLANRPQYADVIGHVDNEGRDANRLLSVVSPDRLGRLLTYMLDAEEFLSPHGLRSVSKFHDANPFSCQLGTETASVDYEPAESKSNLFGGNSNWRGPVWFPTNYLLIGALRRYDNFFDGVQLEPGAEARQVTMGAIADDLSERLISIFANDTDGSRPVFGQIGKFQNDPHWHDRLLFHEYFHGDTGAGIGASHQTGWTGLVADLIITKHQSKRPSPNA